jgi:hypothetical protein
MIANVYETQSSGPDRRKTLVSKAVPHRGPKRNGPEKELKSLAGKGAGPRLEKEPPVEGPPDDRLRLAV